MRRANIGPVGFAAPWPSRSDPVQPLCRKVAHMNRDAKPNAAKSPETLAEAGRVSPTTVFEDPGDVVESDDLTKKEKVRILEQWEADAKALQTATDEGMTGGNRPRLDEVNEAQAKLDDKPTIASKQAP
jgi:hypothetical protein